MRESRERAYTSGMRENHAFIVAASASLVFGCAFGACGGCGAGQGAGAGGGAGGSGGVDGGSAGCEASAKAYPPGTTSDSIVVDGRTRTFRVHVPPGATGPLPVVLVFHGGGGSGEQIELRSAELDPIADREGFVAVYPDGVGLLKTWNGGLCCGKAVEDDVDDVAFVSALLDTLEGSMCLDARRVFATGMSNGAIFSHRLACELSERIAAIAPVAGTIGVPTCAPRRAVPVLEIHGTRDGHVPWAGGAGCGPTDVSFTSVPDTVEGWRVRNGCAATTRVTFEQGDGRCATYDDCGASVVLCTIEGGGHSWPGGAPKGSGVIDCPADGPQSTTFIASEAAWAFFVAHPMTP